MHRFSRPLCSSAVGFYASGMVMLPVRATFNVRLPFIYLFPISVAYAIRSLLSVTSLPQCMVYSSTPSPFPSVPTLIQNSEVTAALRASVPSTVPSYLVHSDTGGYTPVLRDATHKAPWSTRVFSPVPRALRACRGFSGLVRIRSWRMRFLISLMTTSGLKLRVISVHFQSMNALSYKAYLSCGAEAP